MSAADFLPKRRTLSSLARAAKGCQGCPLYRDATQTVFGAGPSQAKVIMVGEQPGDQEDRAGRPFVGPAGRLLDESLMAAGLDRQQVYLTNAVKHFKFVWQGTRRLHKKPGSRELAACRPWLEAEIAAIAPQVVVCLGATAAQSLLGREFRITVDRGRFVDSPWARWTIATYHPSAVLRAPSSRDREAMRKALVADLASIVPKLAEVAP